MPISERFILFRENRQQVSFYVWDLMKTKGAAAWASSKPNLLNVALTRAKLRFVAVGDEKVWLGQPYFCKLKYLMNS